MEEKCNNCIGMCESSAPRSSSVFGGPPLGVHNPFEDLQSTLLQQNTTARKPVTGSEWSAMHRQTPRAQAPQKSQKSHRKKSHTHHEVSFTQREVKHPAKKNKSHAHAEVYQKVEKLKRGTGFVETGQHAHAAHHHSHHHAEVSATWIAPVVETML